ncbi:MAG: PAS domain S-box protein, partial [Candidatus Methylumidiphilus sp.]
MGVDATGAGMAGLGFWAFTFVALLFLYGMLRRRERSALRHEQNYIRALQERVAAQALLAAIVESSDDGIIGKDMEGLITSWNPGAERLFGHSAEEAKGWPGSLLFPADGQETENQLLAKIRQGESLRNFEAVMARRDGREIIVSLTLSPIRDGVGRVVGASMIVRDVTRQKQAEQRIQRLNSELQSRVDELQTVLDVVPVAIAIAYDPACETIQMNRAGEKMLGLSPGINASKSANGGERLPFKVLRDGREVAVEALPMQYAVRHATAVREVEAEVVRLDGTSLTLYEYASPLFDENGAVRGCVGVFVDISERKRAEGTLRQERLFLRQVIDATPNIIFVKGRDGRYLLGNRALLEFFGASEDSVVGKTDAELNPRAEQAARLRGDDLEVLDSRRILRIPEEQVTDASGAAHWFSGVKAPLIDADGRCDKLLGVVIDVTERKRAEEALREADRRKDE